MIVDNILLHDEIDMLELRLNVMGDHVDRIVIVESDHTFTNIPKPYHFEENAERFSRWFDKILYVKAVSPKHVDPWSNEHWSRDQMAKGWTDLTDQDILIVSDVDEVIRPEAIDYIKNTTHNYYGLIMPVSYYKFNYVDVHSTGIGYVAWAGAFRNIGDYPPHQLRKFRGNEKSCVWIHHAGWHFSWIGNDKYLNNKLKSFSHTEFDNDEVAKKLSSIEEIIANKIDHLRDDRKKWDVVKLDNYFPQYILDNKQKYQDFILPDADAKSVFDYYPFNICQVA